MLNHRNHTLPHLPLLFLHFHSLSFLFLHMSNAIKRNMRQVPALKCLPYLEKNVHIDQYDLTVEPQFGNTCTKCPSKQNKLGGKMKSVRSHYSRHKTECNCL